MRASDAARREGAHRRASFAPACCCSAAASTTLRRLQPRLLRQADEMCRRSGAAQQQRRCVRRQQRRRALQRLRAARLLPAEPLPLNPPPPPLWKLHRLAPLLGCCGGALRLSLGGCTGRCATLLRRCAAALAPRRRRCCCWPTRTPRCCRRARAWPRQSKRWLHACAVHRGKPPAPPHTAPHARCAARGQPPTPQRSWRRGRHCLPRWLH